MGADVHASSNELATALIMAVSAISPSPSKVQLLIDRGSEVNAIGPHGVTPLHFAAARDSTVVARILIDAGADKSIRTDDDLTPCDSALFFNASSDTRDLLCS